MALISFRLREGSWRAIGLTLPKPLLRTLLFALGAALIQQAIGQLVVDPLTQPFLHYSREANPMEGGHNISSLLTWLGVIWTYAAFGEEISFRGYLLNRVADIGNRSTAAFIIGLLWSSIMFGFAHWYQGWAGVISASASGLVFGSAYLLSGRNLWVSILAHGLSDTLALILTGLG
jgi:membrane protease YdiL (CAAX protease family)